MTPRLTEVDLPQTVRIPTAPIPAAPAPEELAQALRAQGERVELSGRRVRAVLSGTEGIQWLEGDGVPLVANLLVEDAVGANLVVAPRGARRECFVYGQGFVEALQVPEALPGVVLQWQWTAPTPFASLPLRLRVLPDLAGVDPAGEDRRPVQYHRAPGLLWVGRGEQGVLMTVPGSLALPLIRRQSDAIQVEWDLPRSEDPDEPLTLLIQSAPPETAWTKVPALAAVPAHHRRGEDAAAGTHDGGAILQTGLDEMDEGFRWVRAWTRDRLLTIPKQPAILHPVAVKSAFPEEDSPWLRGATGPAWLALAAAATGDWEAGRGALNALAWDEPYTAMLSALALARWMAWTGEARPIEGQAARLVELLGDGASSLAATASGDEFPVAALQEVRREVAAAGEAAESDDLKALGELPAPVAPGSVRLPTLGTPRAEPLLDPWAFPFQENRSIDDRLQQALRVRESLETTMRDASRLREGLGALAAVQWMAGVMGSRPDATFGRLTLSPLFPPHWTRAGVSGIRVGDGALAVGYTRENRSVRWTMRPQEGSTPVTVILDAWQPLDRISSIRVDGEPAELDVLTAGEWTRVSIQVPVDAARVVELEG